MSLFDATRDLHHACEAHPVGAVMASGKPPRAWYAAWLAGLAVLHRVIDPTLPPVLHRVDRLEDDLAELDWQPVPIYPAEIYAASLTTGPALAGTAYVLTGAHLMGGEVMRRRLEGYPTRHLLWDDRPAAVAELREMRAREDIIDPARECFAGLLALMDWIETYIDTGMIRPEEREDETCPKPTAPPGSHSAGGVID